MFKSIIFFLILFAQFIFAQDIRFFGDAKPGSIIVAKGENITSAVFNKQKLLVDSNGVFVFGFDRDAKGQYILTIKQMRNKIKVFTYQITAQKYQKQSLSLPKKFVSPPAKALKQIKRETLIMKNARIKMLDTKAAFFEKGFCYPVDSVEITGTFGVKRILNGRPKNEHNGIDFGGNNGDSIYAISSGIIRLAEENFYYNGTFVLIDHGQGLSSVYLHLSKLHVKSGQTIKKGELIGEMGATGRSTGPHLHLGVQWYKKRIDPLNVIELKF